MSEEDVTENLAAALEIIGARYPGGAKNIRSLNIKTESSLAIPIHINTGTEYMVLFIYIKRQQSFLGDTNSACSLEAKIPY